MIYAATASDTEFAASALRDMPPATSAVMMTSGDIFQVHIDLTSATGIDMELDVQERLSLSLMPKHGVPTLAEITAPPTLEASSVIVL